MERFLVRRAFDVAALWVAAKLLSGVSVSGDVNALLERLTRRFEPAPQP